MKSLLLAGTALVALAGFTAQAVAQPAGAPAAAQPLFPTTSCSPTGPAPYDGVPPWDKVKPALFDEAFQFAIDELLREAAAIADNPAAPTFANTIEAMEKAGERLDRVGSVFAVMTDNMSTPEYEALDKKWSPKLSAAYDEINLNPKLFERVSSALRSARDARPRRQAACGW